MEQLYCGVSNYSHNFAGEKKIHSIKCKLHRRLDRTCKWKVTVSKTYGFNLNECAYFLVVCVERWKECMDMRCDKGTVTALRMSPFLWIRLLCC